MLKSIVGGLGASVVIVFGMHALADDAGRMRRLGFTKICTLTEEHTAPVYRWVEGRSEPVIEYETSHLCVNEIWVRGKELVTVGEEEEYLAKRN